MRAEAVQQRDAYRRLREQLERQAAQVAADTSWVPATSFPRAWGHTAVMGRRGLKGLQGQRERCRSMSVGGGGGGGLPQAFHPRPAQAGYAVVGASLTRPYGTPRSYP